MKTKTAAPLIALGAVSLTAFTWTIHSRSALQTPPSASPAPNTGSDLAVRVDAGDRAPMGFDGDKHSVFLLSESLKQHPFSTKFEISWSDTVAHGTDEYHLIYDRGRQTLTYGAGGRGKPMADEPAYQSVTETIIHLIAQSRSSYATVRNFGCPVAAPTIGKGQEAIIGEWDKGGEQSIQFLHNGIFTSKMPNPDPENAKKLPFLTLYGSYTLSESNYLTLFHTHTLVAGRRIPMKFTKSIPKISIDRDYATVTNLQNN